MLYATERMAPNMPKHEIAAIKMSNSFWFNVRGPFSL